jgi:site-specific recombinase XerD
VKSLKVSVHEYVAMRRALGFKLTKYEDWLLDFVAFMKRRHSTYITVKEALEWVAQTRSTDQNYRVSHLMVVRGFARYRSAMDPRTEIPLPDLLPRAKERLQPHLYTEEEVRRLLLLTRSQRARPRVRPTIETRFRWNAISPV